MTASSPGLIRVSMAAIMASVAPHVTTTLASGSASIPLKAFARTAIASRSSRAPQVIEYWLYPASSACFAASSISRGGSKSGYPWARFTASWRAAIRVISRITDSGNFWTRSERRGSSIARSSRPEFLAVAIALPSRVQGKGLQKPVGRPLREGTPCVVGGSVHGGTVLRFLAGRCVHGHAPHREPARGVPSSDRSLAGGDGGGRPGDEPLRDDVRLSSKQSVRKLPESDFHAGRRDPVRGPSVDRDRVRRGPRGSRPSPGRLVDHLSGARDWRPAARADLRRRAGEEGDHDAR